MKVRRCRCPGSGNRIFWFARSNLLSWLVGFRLSRFWSYHSISFHPWIKTANRTIVAAVARFLLLEPVGCDTDIAGVNLLPIPPQELFDLIDQGQEIRVGQD